MANVGLVVSPLDEELGQCPNATGNQDDDMKTCFLYVRLSSISQLSRSVGARERCTRRIPVTAAARLQPAPPAHAACSPLRSLSHTLSQIN